ncbi:hypothetical protein K6118_16195 [Kordiimonas sp. A6E486]|nr:hypothetical protein [Kordiimonas marina]
MMHDSVRADIFAMYHAASVGDRAEMAKVDETFKEDAQGFRDAIEKNKQLKLPKEMRSDLNEVDAPLEAYLVKAAHLVQAIRKNYHSLTTDEVVDFTNNFDALGEKMDRVSHRVEKMEISEDNSHLFWSYLVLVLTVLAGVASAGFSLYLRKHNFAHIVGPVTNVSGVMEQLSHATDDEDIVIPYTDRGNEIGRMAKALLVFKEAGEERRRLEAQRLEAEKRQIEEAREREALEEKRQRELEEQALRTQERVRREMADSFEGKIAGVVRELMAKADVLKQSAQAVGRSAKETAAKSGQCVSDSQSAGESVQSVAAGAEEMAASISEISARVQEASTTTRSATDAAAGAVEQVDLLDGVAQRVGEVVKLINDIAEQTNLLALNATIEAARAGDAGKGFAVVASEVKSLANQTAKATQEIESQIEEMQGATRTAISAVRDVTDRIGNIDQISSSIASAVEEQSGATSEIGRSAAMASDMTGNVIDSIQIVGHAAEDNVRTMATVEDAAEQLLAMSEDLERQVADFVEEMRR